MKWLLCVNCVIWIFKRREYCKELWPLWKITLKYRLRIHRRNICHNTHGKRRTEGYCTYEFVLKFSFYIAIHPSLPSWMSQERGHLDDCGLEEAGSLANWPFHENVPFGLWMQKVNVVFCHWLWTSNTGLMSFLIVLLFSWDLCELKIVC